MSLVSLPDLLADAGKGRYAVGYYESWDVYTLEAVVAAAEAERSPVIIGIGGLSANHQWLRSTGIELYGAIAERLARRSSVPIGVLFNEGDSLEETKLAIGAGYNSVMMHTQGWPIDQLMSDTEALVTECRPHGTAVEGEIGALAEMSIDGEIDTSIGQMTEVDAAIEFVKTTGVDCLAVAVGNVHFVTSDYIPDVKVDRIREIDDAVEVPLVLHGGSGTPPDQLQAAVEAGITKVNFGTRLKHVFGLELNAAIREDETDPNLIYGSRFDGDLNTRSAKAVENEVRRLMQVLSSSGKA